MFGGYVLRHKLLLFPDALLVAKQTLEKGQLFCGVSQLDVHAHVHAVTGLQVVGQSVAGIEQGLRLEERKAIQG